MGSIATVTVDTCPLTQDEIVKLGRYQIRTLAEQLDMFKTADEKQAFLRMDVPDQAAEVLKVKLALEAAKSGGGKAVSKPTTRTPSTTKASTTKAAPTVTKEPSNASARTEHSHEGAAGAVAVLEKLQELIEAIASTNANVDALREEMNVRFAGANRLTTAGLCVALELADLKGDCPPDQLLEASIDRIEGVMPTLQAIIGSGEEGADEGNE